jgi:hypothetical protein
MSQLLSRRLLEPAWMVVDEQETTWKLFRWQRKRALSYGPLLLDCWNMGPLLLYGMKGADLLGPTSTWSSNCEGTRFWNESASKEKKRWQLNGADFWSEATGTAELNCIRNLG